MSEEIPKKFSDRMIWLYDYFERPICVKAAQLSDKGIEVMLKLREAGFSDDDCYKGALEEEKQDENSISVEEVQKMVEKCPMSHAVTRILKGELISPDEDDDIDSTVKRFLKGELVVPKKGRILEEA